MIHRRVIGSALALALLAGQTFVFAGRASCAAPRGAKPPACSACAAGAPSGRLSITADRSCCAAPKAAAEREPATIQSARSAESRPDHGALPYHLNRGDSVTLRVDPPRSLESPPSLVDIPHRRTTVLLI